MFKNWKHDEEEWKQSSFFRIVTVMMNFKSMKTNVTNAMFHSKMEKLTFTDATIVCDGSIKDVYQLWFWQLWRLRAVI